MRLEGGRDKVNWESIITVQLKEFYWTVQSFGFFFFLITKKVWAFEIGNKYLFFYWTVKLPFFKLTSTEGGP